MNTPANQNCPRCKSPIPQEAPGDLCPKCVLEGAALGSQPIGPDVHRHGEAPSIERVADAFPHLEILGLIGKGGMGFVFKARQPRLDRVIALKLLPEELALETHFTERFHREGRALARLNHPNIVTIFDFGRAGDFFYLMMEFVNGVNLREAMSAKKFTPADALEIVPKICDALQYAHEQGVLHRDIKPENILLDQKGNVKIADFGIAKLVGEDPHSLALTGTGATLGTAHYMAPEQMSRPGEVDNRADIYSLGVVFYELLTGELPIGRFAAPSRKTPLDHRIDDIVLRALERERELRQKDARELKTQVEHLTDHPEEKEPGASAPRTGPHGTLVLSGKRSKGLATKPVALVGLTVLICGVSLWLVNRPKPLNVIAPPSRTDFETPMGWVEVLHFRSPQLQPAVHREKAEDEPWIRFTFTAVEIVEEAGRRWLAFDYAGQTHGACERAFRSKYNVTGFEGQVRLQESLSQEKDTPAVRHQRAAFLLPPSISRAASERLRNDLAVIPGKSLKVYLGDEVPLFELHLENGGTMAAWLNVAPSELEAGK